MRSSCLLRKSRFSTYSPGATRMVSPDWAPLMALWMVGKAVDGTMWTVCAEATDTQSIARRRLEVFMVALLIG